MSSNRHERGNRTSARPIHPTFAGAWTTGGGIRARIGDVECPCTDRPSQAPSGSGVRPRIRRAAGPGQGVNAARAWENSVERFRGQLWTTPVGRQHESVEPPGAQPRVVPVSRVGVAIAGLVVAVVNDHEADALVI